MKKKTFKFLGLRYTFSVSRIKSWKSQIAHFLTHFLIALWDPMFSLGGALFIEARDGEQGHLDPTKEGFNIFPDFFFRVAGVACGYLVSLWGAALKS